MFAVWWLLYVINEFSIDLRRCGASEASEPAADAIGCDGEQRPIIKYAKTGNANIRQFSLMLWLLDGMTVLGNSTTVKHRNII